jgi:hypothetical protein
MDDSDDDSTKGRPYVGRPSVPHIWKGSFRHLQRHSASTDARPLLAKEGTLNEFSQQPVI